MAWATIQPAGGTGRHRAGGYGLILLASVLLLVLRCFYLIDGFAAVARSHVFIASAHGVFSDPRTWGWITLIPAPSSWTP